MWAALFAASCLLGAASTEPLYTNQFAVRISDGDPFLLAEKHGFINIGQIGSLKGYYLFEHPRVHKRSTSPHHAHYKNLKSEPKVEWVAQQVVKKRSKREGLWDVSTPSPARVSFPDPLYDQQWYLNGGADGGMDMNVAPAWAKGYTGKGVVVTILDDGIQPNHPDLADNYDPKASSDINDNDSDPTPRDTGDNKHGTRCAGEVAASAYNGFCGVGVAFNASIGGVRMLDGTVGDAVEARSLSLNPDHVDIYSASWGPEDDGKTVDGPGPLAIKAFVSGITKGRGGKGSIFVWASGNGGIHEDSCNCDGYTNSIYTLSISSATQAGLKPWYLEECSSTMATTYSSGTLGRDRSVATVDMDAKLRKEHLCTKEHTGLKVLGYNKNYRDILGTSASAPIAAGMCALALEANPNLTWRDMQHILVLSANPKPLLKETGWTTNGARKRVSHKFGFGLMDGGAMVNLAEQWTTVPAQHVCKTPIMTVDRRIDKSKKSELFLFRNESGCEGSENEVRYLEHVQCKIKLRVKPRGSLKIVLTSPSGTPSVLLKSRPKDNVVDTLDDWPFLSVHFWGEDPKGTWKLAVYNDGRRERDFDGVFNRWQLILYGTDTKPVNLRPPSLQPFRKLEDKERGEDSGYDENNNLEETGEIVYNCHSECDGKGCYGPESTQCISCANYKLNRSCVPQCPEEGYFGADGVCLRCHKDCSTCTGLGHDSCLTCAKNLYYVTDLSLCIRSCPHTYYQEEEARRCLSCHETCSSCEEGPTRCSSCEPHLYLYNGSCVASCPHGTFLYHHSRCVTCHPSCEYCDGPRQSDCIVKHKDMRCIGGACTRCPNGLLAQNTSCVSSCGQGWYQVDRMCKPCWSGCLTCYGSRKDECVTCASGRTLAKGQCRLHCPRNMYSTSTGCANCHHFCSTCNGGGAYSCTTCALERYLDEPSGLCYSCHSSCLTCSGPSNTSCTSCKENVVLENGQCFKLTPNEASGCPNCLHSEGGKVHSSPAGKRRISESLSWEETVEDEPIQAFHRGKPQEYSPFVTVTVIAVIACVAIIILFALLFATLQVR